MDQLSRSYVKLKVNSRNNPSKSLNKQKFIAVILLLCMLSLNIYTVLAADITLSKLPLGPDGTVYKCGSIVQIQIGISSDVPLYDLRIEDHLDPDETYDTILNTQSTNPASTFSYDSINNKLIWDFGQGPFFTQPQATIDYSIKIAQVVTDGDLLTNTAWAYYKLQPGGEESSTSIPEAIMVGCPIIDIDKTGPSSLYNGSAITWTITLTNTGSFAAEDVEITDVIPPGVVGPITAEETSLPHQGTISVLTGPDRVFWTGVIPNGTSVVLQVSGIVNTSDDYIDNTGVITNIKADVHTIKIEDTWRTQILVDNVGGNVYDNPLSSMRYVIIGLMGFLVVVTKKLSN